MWLPDHQINGIVVTDLGVMTRTSSPVWFLDPISLTTFTRSNERYSGLDLDYYKSVMCSQDYEVFVNYVGAEKIGIRDEDFEVYYPED